MEEKLTGRNEREKCLVTSLQNDPKGDFDLADLAMNMHAYLDSIICVSLIH